MVNNYEKYLKSCRYGSVVLLFSQTVTKPSEVTFVNNKVDDVRGVLNSLEGFAREATLETFPVSLIALGALKQRDPDLAKVIFEVAMVGPMKRVMEDRGCGNFEWYEETLSRFRQESLETLYHQLHFRFAEALLGDLFENGKQQMESREDPVKVGDEFTPGAIVLLRSCALEVKFTLTAVAPEQERQVTLCLASALVPPQLNPCYTTSETSLSLSLS